MLPDRIKKLNSLKRLAACVIGLSIMLSGCSVFHNELMESDKAEATVAEEAVRDIEINISQDEDDKTAGTGNDAGLTDAEVSGEGKDAGDSDEGSGSEIIGSGSGADTSGGKASGGADSAGAGAKSETGPGPGADDGPGSNDKKPEMTEADNIEVGVAPGNDNVIEEITDYNIPQATLASTAAVTPVHAETYVTGRSPSSDSGSGSTEGAGTSSGSADSSSGSSAGGSSASTESGSSNSEISGSTGSGTSENNGTSQETEEQKPSEHVTWTSCLIEGGDIVIKGYMDGSVTPSDTEMGQDPNFYLLELEPFEDSIAGHRMISSCTKATDISFTIPLNEGTVDDRLYNRFLVCIWTGHTYIPVSDTICVTNPEAIAKNKTPYKEPLSKKGLLIEISEISDAFSLGVCNVIINIPFDTLIGSGIDYEYDGEIYHFDKNVVAAYDKTISMFSNKSMNVSAILLNRYNPDVPELFYPGTKHEGSIMYHNFNAATEDGYKYIKATASFLASRYDGSNPDHGRIQNWIVGNEINNQNWNYVGPMPLNDYVREYVRSFRVFYNAIKSCQAEARVFFSLDNNWNQGNDNSITYTAKDTLTAVANEISAHGNVDWGLAYHPYCVPTVEPEFWDDFSTGQVSWSTDSKVVNFANLSILTDYMQQSFMLDTKGNVRHIILSEQGFTSESATRGTVEELQAASFAYAYYIVDSNPYIDAFILSRQIDAPSEVKSSLAFGLWTTTATEDVNIRPYRKKYIWNVFKNIDKQATTLEYSEFAKEIIGIENWYDVIPDFKWTRQEKNGY